MKKLSNQKYNAQKYFISDCFYNSKIKEGDKVIVFCYEYEGYYNISGSKSIIKVTEFEAPIVISTKTYIKSNQNPIKIKKDIKLWDKKGLGSSLKQMIKCRETLDRKNKQL